MEDKFDKQLEDAYQEYLKLPLADETNYRDNEIYNNGWYTLTGLRTSAAPLPHRHYSLLTFVFWCGQDKKLHRRFLK